MFAHVTIRAASREESERFYRTVLGAIGIEPTHDRADIVAWEDFAIIEADGEHPPTHNLHVGFVAESREAVDRFWQAGVDAGYEDDGAPGERLQYAPDYYGGFLRDPDGNSAEAVHHGDTRRGGNVDHLWIGVRDLDAAASFYETVARYTGLRGGRRWEHGRQFRGAWATFSLIADGAPADREPAHRLPRARPGDRSGIPRRRVRGRLPRSTAARASGRSTAPATTRRYVLDPDGTNVESVWRA